MTFTVPGDSGAPLSIFVRKSSLGAMGDPPSSNTSPPAAPSP